MKNLIYTAVKISLTFVLLSLAACGGGGGGTATPTPTNVAPVANAGPDQTIYRGELVTLDSSSSSDVNGDSLSYSWVFSSKPATSAATLSSATAANPSFTADVDGNYVLSLIVNDGSLSSAADSVTIAVTYEQAVVSMTLVGGTDTIGSIQFDLVLPAGFSLAADTLDVLDAGVITAAIAGSSVDTNYMPEDTLNFGQLTVGVIHSTGFSASLFTTLIHDMAEGESLPLNTDFTVSNLVVSDLNGAVLSGYSVGLTLLQQTVTP